ncbi:MAG: NAD(P)/FAD-dependent oxidoreductase [Bacteroidota bacterium]
MIEEVNVVVKPSESADIEKLKLLAAAETNRELGNINHIEILKRSIDARGRSVKINLRLKLYINETPDEKQIWELHPIQAREVKNQKEIYIVGAGPAGLFAALQAIENGCKPIIIERGKSVRDRRRDLAAINKNHVVNSDSNYCFGEGGAGTYSDGKLYTRSGKRGSINKVLHTFVHHGADVQILIDAHPHIGTNKLPKIIENMRAAIIECGGEILFNHRLEDIHWSNHQLNGISICSVETGSITQLKTDKLILATGHSARDIYRLLDKKKITIEAKPFALGVRVEHPQSLIDSIQYHCAVNEVLDTRRYLPAASYSLVEQVNHRGVYSFCMCPGGIIAPCATAPGEIVTNGWSPSKRNNPFANSGIVVEVNEIDFKPYQNFHALAGMQFQAAVEQNAWQHGGMTQTAPAQRLVDFVNKTISSDLPTCSYQPGVASVDLHQVLPVAVADRLRLAFGMFGKKMKGYLTNEAIVVGVESRTSTPVRIPRHNDTLCHIAVNGLYPCGEGAGYAGGIVSAAMDGIKCANAACG